MDLQIWLGILAILLTLLGILSSWYFYRKGKADAYQHLREQYQRELVNPVRRTVEEIKHKVGVYESVDKTKLEELLSRARDWNAHIIQAALSDLFTPVNLWNEFLRRSEKIIDEKLAEFGLDNYQLNDTLGEEIDRIHGEIHITRDFLYDIGLYMTGSSEFLASQWLKSICIIFKRAKTFASLGPPAGIGVGGLMTEVDGQYIVIAPYVKDRAKLFFETVKQEIKGSLLETLGKNLLEACESSLAKIERVKPFQF
jgi:hypothetical protein